MVDMMTRMWECVFVLHVWEALEMLESAVRKSAKKFGNLHGFHDGGDVGVRVHSEVAKLREKLKFSISFSMSSISAL